MQPSITQLTAFAKELETIMQDDERVYAMTADLVGSCGLANIENHVPAQFINVGVAEQNMIGIAAGLAKEGLLPFAYTFATFNSMRACEQIRSDVFYNDLNVKVVGTHCGVSTGQAGSTHFSLEDIGILRSMPQSVVVVPADPVATKKTARLLYNYPHGVYVRLDRNPLPNLYAETEEFAIGKGHVLRQGTDIVLYTIGAVTGEALKAAAMIEDEVQKSVAVVDVYSVKPLDEELIVKFAETCKEGYAIEEHNVNGGLYGAIAECLAPHSTGCLLHAIGINNCYPKGNTVERLRRRLGLDAEGITKKVVGRSKGASQ